MEFTHEQHSMIQAWFDDGSWDVWDDHDSDYTPEQVEYLKKIQEVSHRSGAMNLRQAAYFLTTEEQHQAQLAALQERIRRMEGVIGSMILEQREKGA